MTSDIAARRHSFSVAHRTRLLQALVQVGAALLLVAGYILYIRRYGVNLPFWDEWTLGHYVLRLSEGQLTLGELLSAKHNEHLVGASFALMLLHHAATGYDSKAILYFSAALQVGSLALLLSLARPLLPTGPRRGWHALVLATLMLSLAPSWNILWGFQTAWYLITFFLLGCLWLLERSMRAPPGRASFAWLVAAAAAATLASFSSIHGLAAWLAGAVFLFVAHHGNWRMALMAPRMRAWAAAAVSCLILFAWVFSLTPTTHSTTGDLLAAATAGPAALGAFALGILSTAWGDHLNRSALLAGGAIAVLCAAGIMVAIRSAERARFALPLALLVFAAVFVAMVAVGRFRFGAGAALEARYSSYVLLAVVAAYLILLSATEGASKRKAVATVRIGLVAMVLVMFASSTVLSLRAARNWRLDRGIGAMVLLNFENEPPLKIKRTIHFDAELVKKQARELRVHSLSTFRSGKAAIPAQAAVYASPPRSLIELWEERPADRAALERLWHVYVVGGDVRSAFPMNATGFPIDLIAWAARSAGGSHYLAPYLAEYADRYARMRDDLLAAKVPRISERRRNSRMPTASLPALHTLASTRP